MQMINSHPLYYTQYIYIYALNVSFLLLIVGVIRVQARMWQVGCFEPGQRRC